ncbi:hypothetical protein REPUB_Repub20aG0048500 [Reevesia pubescens]
MFAVLFGLQVVEDSNFTHLHVESDSLLIVRELNKQSPSFWEWSCISPDIHSLSASFDLCLFKYVPHAINGLAHDIAKLECEIEEQR